DVREVARDAAHHGPLPPVPIAAAAEDAQDASRRELARRPEDALERTRLVRVVDDHRERLAFVDGLEPARHAADRLQAAGDRAVVDPESPRRRERAERVLD